MGCIVGRLTNLSLDFMHHIAVPRICFQPLRKWQNCDQNIILLKQWKYNGLYQTAVSIDSSFHLKHFIYDALAYVKSFETRVPVISFLLIFLNFDEDTNIPKLKFSKQEM